ncbi:MAG: hypothetical protein WC291_03400 [Thermodesulfovibrionales bacterium]|jgi:hypothetical protein
MPRHKRRYSLLSYLCLVPFLILLLACFAPAAHAASYWRSDISAKRYILYGTVDLTYEREWGNDRPEATQIFTQDYELGVRGFVVDPRLVSFDVAGMFNQSTVTDRSSLTLKGFRANATFLQQLPQAGGKVLKYLPHPIQLRLTDYTGSYSYKNYGVSLWYTFPDEFLFYKKKDVGSNKNFHVPRLYFDYDKYTYENRGARVSTDFYSLRAAMNGEHYDYRFLYELEKGSGDIQIKRQSIEFLPVYRFFDEKTRRSLDIFNSLRFDKINDTKYTNILVLPRLYMPMGKDTAQLVGNFNYSSISASKDSTESYGTSVAASYGKVFSPRLTNTVTAAAGFGKSDKDYTSFARLNDTALADISRTLAVSGSVALGQSDKGTEYGAEGYIYTKTLVRTMAGYSFTSLPQDDSREVAHRFYLTATGPLLKTASFDVTAQYIVRDVSDTISPFRDDLLYTSANLYWYFWKTSFTMGGSYSYTLSRTDHRSSNSFTSLYANASRYLTPRTYLNLYTTWQQDNNDVKRFEFRPGLIWRRGLTYLDLEYDYRWTSSSDEPSEDHRLVVHFVRNIYNKIY